MRRLNRKGFTLIEVIISTLIMSIIIMIILPVFMSIMETKNMMELRGTRQMREAQALMSMMQKELKSAFLPNREGEDKFIIINTNDLEGNPMDSIYFSSFSHFMGDGADAFSDQCEVGYYIKDDNEKRSLYRKESRVVDSDLIEGGEEIKLTDSITYFDIVPYSDGFSSDDDFGVSSEDETVNTFPKGIMIRFGLKTDDGRVKNYETAVNMPAYKFGTGEEEVKEEGDQEDTQEEEKDKEGTEDGGEETGDKIEPKAD